MTTTSEMLEIHRAEGALERIEAYLRADGFFHDGGVAAAGRRADVFLGYGLAAGQRRTDVADPPEPAALPLAACRIGAIDDPLPPAADFSVGAWQRTWSEAGYVAAVDAVREAIGAGEVYQVNLVQHLAATFEGDPAGVAAALARFSPLVPRPLVGSGWSIVSASPELFLARRGDRLWTMPVKGTRPEGGAQALRGSQKDAAEHMMIVDLERNDLGRVSRVGSLRWPQVMAARRMAGVVHLVSTVEGEVAPGSTWSDLVGAMFPGGSVTGAPKIAALDHIAALEPVGRGASMGAIGSIWPNGDFELALTIRTFAIVDGLIHLWVGGGIVWDSEPLAEVEESWVKARPLLAALSSEAAAPTAVPSA